MNILAIDTSGPVLSVALKCGTLPIQEKVHLEATGHMENLLPFIDELLLKHSLQLEQIDSYFINRGPGSFTGLRIGFSTLKGFLAIHPKPCYGCDSLDTLAERIPTAQEKNMAICLDAFRAKFYVKIFENRNNQWFPISESEALPFEDALHKIPTHALIAGDGLKRHRAVFESTAEKKSRFAEEDFWYSRASSLIQLQKSRPAAVKKLVSSDDFLPVYLRQSEPEERRNEKMSSEKI